jgi:effector-binding domain-containing protein
VDDRRADPHPAGLTAAAWYYLALFAAAIVALILEPIPVSAVGLGGVTIAAVLALVSSRPDESRYIRSFSRDSCSCHVAGNHGTDVPGGLWRYLRNHGTEDVDGLRACNRGLVDCLSGCGLSGRETMNPNVTRLEVEPLHLAAIRDHATHADLGSKIRQHVGTLLQYFKESQVQFNRCVILYECDGSDRPFPIAVGWEVDAPFAGDGAAIVSVATPAGMAATATHIGPYDRMHEANEAILAWCDRNAHQIAGPSWEVYDHPRDGQPPRTDVFYLLR